VMFFVFFTASVQDRKHVVVDPTKSILTAFARIPAAFHSSSVVDPDSLVRIVIQGFVGKKIEKIQLKKLFVI
jgi:hypothetical protein